MEDKTFRVKDFLLGDDLRFLVPVREIRSYGVQVFYIRTQGEFKRFLDTSYNPFLKLPGKVVDEMIKSGVIYNY